MNHSYTITLDDLSAYTVNEYRKYSKLKLFPYSFIQVFVWVLSLSYFLIRPLSIDTLVANAIFAVIITLVYITLLQTYDVRWKAKKFYSESTKIVGKQQYVEIAPKGINTKIGEGTSFSPWDDVMDISQTKKHIFVHFLNGTMLSIPVDSFSSDEAANDFFAELIKLKN